MPYIYAYPRPALTVDIILLRAGQTGTEVLLVERGHPPFAGHWALPGGFVDESEPLEAAARRELQEETSVEDVNLQQLAAFGDPGRDPRGWTVSVVFWAHLDRVTPIVRAGDDAADARWWPMDTLPPLAFDHAEIMAKARTVINESFTNH